MVSKGGQLDFDEGLLLTDLVLRAARRYSDVVSLVDGESGRSFTYGHLAELVDVCAVSLGRSLDDGGGGLDVGDRVCLILPNSIEFPLAFLSILRLGAVCVPLNPALTEYELDTIFTECQPRIIIVDVSLVSTVSVVPSARNVKIIVVGQLDGYTSFDSLLDATNVGVSGSQPLQSMTSSSNPRDRLATLFYTSGTTGRPKGCVHTHYNFVAASYSAFSSFYGDDVKLGERASRDVTIATLPLCHMFGLYIQVIHALTAGLTTVFMRKFQPHDFLRLALKYRATVLHVVPVILIRILETNDVARIAHCLSSVKYISSSAVRLSDDVIRRIETLLPNVVLRQEYGMTETTLVSYPVRGKTPPGCVGRLMPGFIAKVVDTETERVVEHNAVGELRFKSPTIMKMYWNADDATRLAFDDEGWFKTGDRGSVDDDGNVFIVDRIKDILKYKGFQVSPSELESVLLQHPDVVDVAVVGVPDDVAGQLPRAIVIPRRPDANADDIIHFVHQRVAIYKRLRGGLQFVSEIPRSPSGKILRRTLLDAKL